MDFSNLFDGRRWSYGTDDFGIGFGIGVGFLGLAIGPGVGIGFSKKGDEYSLGVGGGLRGGFGVGPAIPIPIRVLGLPLSAGLVFGPAVGYGTSLGYTLKKDQTP